MRHPFSVCWDRSWSAQTPLHISQPDHCLECCGRQSLWCYRTSCKISSCRFPPRPTLQDQSPFCLPHTLLKQWSWHSCRCRHQSWWARHEVENSRSVWSSYFRLVAVVSSWWKGQILWTLCHRWGKSRLTCTCLQRGRRSLNHYALCRCPKTCRPVPWGQWDFVPFRPLSLASRYKACSWYGWGLPEAHRGGKAETPANLAGHSQRS